MTTGWQPSTEAAGTGVLPTLIVTGASGFIGRNVLAVARERYRIFALARRSQREAGVPPHPNIRWLMSDIADPARLGRLFDEIAAAGGADFLLHLAGFYRFDRLQDPEYRRTNVDGTRNVLDQAGKLTLRRVAFASSITVCDFLHADRSVDETTAPDADFPYARSKAAGERMMREYAGSNPGSVVRLAAVFSDWCEYGPLYMLLSNWFSDGWCSRIVPGRGLTAIPYIHVSYVVELFLKIFEMTDRLARYDVYVASPARAVSHRDLFELATSYYYGHARSPVLMPVPLARVGLLCRNTARTLFALQPRERLWMLRYVDRVLTVDPSYTLSTIPVRQRRRLQLTRRIAFIVENAKNFPLEWRSRNEAAMRKTLERPELLIGEVMRARAEEIVDRIVNRIVHDARLESYRAMDPERLRWYVTLIFRMLTHAMGTGDRTALIDYARYLARARGQEGFAAEEVKQALRITGAELHSSLLEDPSLGRFRQAIRDDVQLCLEPACDEIDDAYEENRERPVFRRGSIARR